MELRSVLTPKPLEEHVEKELVALLGKIEEALETSDVDRARPLIDAFNDKTGRRYQADDFARYWEAVSAEEFVASAFFKETMRSATSRAGSSCRGSATSAERRSPRSCAFSSASRALVSARQSDEKRIAVPTYDEQASDASRSNRRSRDAPHPYAGSG